MILRKPLIVAAIALSLLGISASAAPCPCTQQNRTMQKPMQGAAGMPHGKMFVQNVIHALGKTGLSTEQTKKAIKAINTFKQASMQMRQARNFPIDAFTDQGFDKAKFQAAMEQKFQAKVSAKTALFESIYAILDGEQKKVFKREFTAPMVMKMMRKDLTKGSGMKPKGKSCQNCGMGARSIRRP